MKTKRIIGIGLIPIFAFTLFFGLANSVWAGLFKYVDENGKTHYTDSKAKIPRKYRDKGKMKTVRGFGAAKSSGSSQDSGASKGQDSKKGSPDILSQKDMALLAKAEAFLKKEIEFAKKYKDNAMTPTGQRGFVAAMNGLVPEKEAMAQAFSQGESGIMKEVAGHMKSTLEAAKSNPISMRKLSVANAITRLQDESAAKVALLGKIKQAKELSKQKSKEAADKKAKDKAGKKADKPTGSKDTKSSSKSGYKK